MPDAVVAFHSTEHESIEGKDWWILRRFKGHLTAVTLRNVVMFGCLNRSEEYNLQHASIFFFNVITIHQPLY